MVKELKITDGPDRKALFNSLEYAQDDNVSFPVSFKGFIVQKDISKSTEIVLKPQLHAIRHAANAYDLSAPNRGQEFIISGFCKAEDLNVYDGADYIGFEAHYSTITKSGNMVFNSTAIIQSLA
ncbi:hypothetical protein IKE84_01250 [Candidatus Saccharibacteria bacterium]|nr:hypothetical protein [Candidatus Saccharibacteria bacterium]